MRAQIPKLTEDELEMLGSCFFALLMSESTDSVEEHNGLVLKEIALEKMHHTDDPTKKSPLCASLASKLLAWRDALDAQEAANDDDN
uniref:Uncharacterized protein n=1 Tax=viral metagenome TaxID=1070528 RepID=A0A6M3LGE2_9ZZZZ